jgi:hypothetical protein
LGTGAVLVRAHNGAVDHGVFIVRIGRQNLEHLFPHAALGPAGKSGVKLDRVAEAFRQVSLRIPVKATTLSGAWRPRDPVDDDQGGARA